MSLQELLELGVKNQEEDSSDSVISFFDVAKAQVDLCWQAFAGTDTKEFIYVPTKDKSGEAEARASASAYLKEIGRDEYNGKINSPSQGFVTTIFGDEVPTHPNGSMGDWVDFIKEYCRNKNAKAVGLNPEDISNTNMPYDTILYALKGMGRDIPLGRTKWCLIEQVVNKWEKAKGDKGKKVNGHPVRFRVIRKVYKDKAEAIKDAENYKRDTNTAIATPQLSAKAIENDVTIEHIKDQSDDIAQWRKEGEDEKQIADRLSIEIPDLALAGLALADKIEMPF